MANPQQIEMYTQFRKELDKLCIPLILSEKTMMVQNIMCDGKTVGILCAYPNYIDCVYILPEYRHKGLAKKAVLDWFDRYRHRNVRLHIINNNEPAKAFWNRLFELKEIESNPIDTLYEIEMRKEE